ncbi:DUF192 domain-containing protein [Pseudotabrizicola sp. L79]|uniref:DUF192 domain-containing protein n=1 Tax=Pseudotabrizicola sp. L79 TaxID=3118402 RepID=UPI002F958C3B
MGSSGTGWSTGLILGVALMLGASAAQAAACRADEVVLRWPGGQARFAVEVADDAAERSQGLMHREKMAQSAGMLFVYEAPQRASFWMANTLIPLDMIFADAQGRVTRVHENAIPQDRTAIEGGDAVQFVLEINGGLARRLGIGEGAELRHPAIVDAAWPCAAE